MPVPTKDFAGITWCYAALQPVLLDDVEGTLADIEQTTGVDSETVVAANEVAWDIQAINRWVIASGGKWLPQVGPDAVRGSPTGGWAVFQVGNEIWLPHCEVTVEAIKKTERGAWLKWLGGLLVVGGGGWLVFGGKKSPARRRKRRRRG